MQGIELSLITQYLSRGNERFARPYSEVLLNGLWHKDIQSKTFPTATRFWIRYYVMNQQQSFLHLIWSRTLQNRIQRPEQERGRIDAVENTSFCDLPDSKQQQISSARTWSRLPVSASPAASML